MQSLEIISINLWQILISFCNLLLLFLILKKFLYKPVKQVMTQRRVDVGTQYAKAEKAENAALAHKKTWEQKMQSAQQEADVFLKKATANAEQRSDKIIAEAKEKAAEMIRQAQSEAQLERKKASEEIKHEIVDISTLLTEKMLVREINQEDHRNLIRTFVKEIGEKDDGNQ